MSAGFTGLLVAIVFLLAVVTAVVHITNQRFAGHGERQTEAGPTQH